MLYPVKKYTSLDLTTSVDCDWLSFDLKSTDPVLEKGGKFSVRGAGTSLVAASFGTGSKVLELSGSTDMLLDEEAGLLKVSAATDLTAIYNFLAPKGYYLRAVPSHPSATVGGCIGYDAHGQNHYRDGTFCDQVVELELYHPAHGHREISRDSFAGIFELTLGGLGLTGVITEATLRVYPLSSGQIKLVRLPFNSFAESYGLFMEHRESHDFFHSLFELSGVSGQRQRGYVELAKIVDEGSPASPVDYRYNGKLHRLVKPNIFGSSAMRYITRMHHHWKVRRRSEIMSLFDFLHPSAKRMFYFSMFGSRGLIEHQVLVPHEKVDAYFAELGDILNRYKPIIPLCHTKLFGGERKALRFTGSGYSYAIHVPNNQKHLRMLAEIDELDVDCGCIANIYKDSRLGKKEFEDQYGSEVASFTTRLKSYDPKLHFSHSLSQRLLDI